MGLKPHHVVSCIHHYSLIQNSSTALKASELFSVLYSPARGNTQPWGTCRESTHMFPFHTVKRLKTGWILFPGRKQQLVPSSWLSFQTNILEKAVTNPSSQASSNHLAWTDPTISVENNKEGVLYSDGAAVGESGRKQSPKFLFASSLCISLFLC